jgi:hypothetical protein
MEIILIIIIIVKKVKKIGKQYITIIQKNEFIKGIQIKVFDEILKKEKYKLKSVMMSSNNSISQIISNYIIGNNLMNKKNTIPQSLIYY